MDPGLDRRAGVTRPHASRHGTGVARVARAALVVVPLAYLAVFFLWPVVRIVDRGLRSGGHWDLAAFADVAGDASTRHLVWFTVWQAVASTVLTLVLALPAAYVFGRYSFRGKALLRAAITVPFVLPTIVVASAFLGVAGPRGLFGGWVALDGTVWIILLAHAFFNYAVVVRVVSSLWSHLDPSLEDAARTLGASRWRVWREITWPLVRPAVLSSAAIVFLFCFTSFGVVLLLGGQGMATLEVAIKRATLDRLDLRTASVLAILQWTAVVAALVAAGRMGNRAVPQRLLAGHDASHPPRGRERVFLVANLAVMAVLLGVPIGVLVERSLHPAGGYGLAFYRALFDPPAAAARFVPPLDAVRNSLEFAVVATALALVVGGLAAFAVAGVGRARRGGRGLFELALMLPLGTSAVTVGFGFLLALDRPVDLRTSWIIVPVAHSLVAIPFVVRIVVPVLRSIDPRLR